MMESRLRSEDNPGLVIGDLFQRSLVAMNINLSQSRWKVIGTTESTDKVKTESQTGKKLCPLSALGVRHEMLRKKEHPETRHVPGYDTAYDIFKFRQ
jgi:hypothetical protein